MLEDLRIRNYAPTTVECYIRSVAGFARHFHQPPDQLGVEEIRAFQLYLLREKRVELSTYIQAVCALRFFYRNTLNRRSRSTGFPLPRYEKKLPVVLSKPEVKALLESADEPQAPGDFGDDVCRGTPRIRGSRPESFRSGSRTPRHLAARRQRP